MNIHFTGIGGIGMSALARYFLAKGDSVSGSDSSASPLTTELQNEGVEWIDAHMPIPSETDLHIYSEAVGGGNPNNDIQRQSALALSIPSFSYFEQIGELSKQYKTIAICGTHGKSTTTAMTGIAFSKAGLDPLVIVGTKVREFEGKNIRLQNSELRTQNLENSKFFQLSSKIFIVEACEYRGSFLHIQPFGVVLTNCEHDHIDYYKTKESYIETFKKFVAKIPKNGFLVANFDDAHVVEISKHAQCKIIPVQLSEIKNPITPKVPGWHNQLNAELAFACGKEVLNHALCSKEEKIEKLSTFNFQLSAYAGTWRRFDILGEKNGVLVIDDYAHHPSEIRATLKALKGFSQGKSLVIVFQPHQYSRTREFFDDFVKSFAQELKTENAKLFITDIYEARDSEKDKQAVSAELLAETIQKQGIACQYSGNYEQTLSLMYQSIQSGDVLITMGAGPVNQVAESFLQSDKNAI